MYLTTSYIARHPPQCTGSRLLPNVCLSEAFLVVFITPSRRAWGQHAGLSAGLTILHQVPPLTREEGHREPAAGLVGTARGPVLALGAVPLSRVCSAAGRVPVERRPPPISGQAGFGAPHPSLHPAMLIFAKPSNLSFLPEIGCEVLTHVRAGVAGPRPPTPALTL